MENSIIEDENGKRPMTAEEIQNYLKDAANAPISPTDPTGA